MMNKKVNDVMTRGVELIDVDFSIREAAEMMRDLDIGVAPVAENDELVGMLTDRDIVIRAIAEGLDPDDTSVRDVMTEDVEYCYEDDDLEEAGRIMRDRQIRRLIVLNRGDEVIGILSLGDLATKTQDEEMAGDVLQEISEPSKPER
ncbi:MAG: CBS domain-containing protein [Candidatus Zixiibacteriota bacterium]|nr:MAG: CBS domain-containing protein [candidate division Zixibacteria bacterium]